MKIKQLHHLLGGIILSLFLTVNTYSNEFSEQLNSKLIEITEKVMPAIVHIKVKRNIGSNLSLFSPPDDSKGEPQRNLIETVGSGVIVSKKGYIVTNHHVIQDAEEIILLLHDDKEYFGEIVGSDEYTDVALIKFKTKPENFHVATLGDSDKLKVGEMVLALGSPFGLRESVTQGIVSAKARKNPQGVNVSFIQTDAAINPGNSGGALVNLKGEVIGINAMILARSLTPMTAGFQGIGLAIPINLAKNVMKQIIKHGRVIRGFLGVHPANVDKTTSKLLKVNQGVMINLVIPDSPADKAGIKPWDRIIKINDTDVDDFEQLRTIIADTKVGRRVQLTIFRNEKKMELRAVIEDFDKFSNKRKPKKQEKPSKPKINVNDPSMGLELKPLPKETRKYIEKKFRLFVDYGVLVTKVQKNSLASEAGLEEGDVILEVEARPIKSPPVLFNAVREFKKDKFFRIRILKPKSGLIAIIPVKFE